MLSFSPKICIKNRSLLLSRHLKLAREIIQKSLALYFGKFVVSNSWFLMYNILMKNQNVLFGIFFKKSHTVDYLPKVDQLFAKG